ncbi:hypothetical protein EDD18DRAFT_1358477 [Armillaria luteobubalina]|uniref:Uncharacterized protein n=1 Tax=Armillaria luteobubalina TaxID=153913 RepID=A0AA39PWH0_9AGAR|nr:hypothetical protein EDD18DRAFT_1358477 [Armillaria luteobubalina]
MAQDVAAEYHPTFNAPDADTVLSSLDGTLYRLPSSVLKPIPIHERDVVLERFLQIISGLAIPPWRTVDDLEGVLKLAGIWSARGVVNVMRASIMTPMFLREPLRVYAISTRFGWEEQAELASRHALKLSLHEEQHQEVLRRIPMCALVRLFKFHRKRQDEFRVGMQGEGHVTCAVCGEAVDEEAWAALLWRMFWEIDARPSGERLCSLEVKEWEETERCFGEKCTECGWAVYERLDVLERVRKCLAELPDTVWGLACALGLCPSLPPIRVPTSLLGSTTRGLNVLSFRSPFLICITPESQADSGLNVKINPDVVLGFNMLAIGFMNVIPHCSHLSPSFVDMVQSPRPIGRTGAALKTLWPLVPLVTPLGLDPDLTAHWRDLCDEVLVMYGMEY